MNKICLKDAEEILGTSSMFYSREEDNLVIFSYHYANPKVFMEHPIAKELRGIVFDKETGEVVARPFPKFFNLGEEACTVTEDDVVTANEKIDGSLISLFARNPKTRKVI